jgi:hypothetical protein
VPKISISKNGKAGTRENEIWVSGQARVVLAESEATPVQQGAQPDFRPGVSAAIRRHRTTTLLRRQVVHHR